MNQYKESAGKSYMPSNGTEGMMYEDKFCSSCIHQHPKPENKLQCWDVLYKALCGEQPEEWIYDDNGHPTCTKFVKFDWGNDEDGWNEPPEPEPDDPNQLCFNWFLLDILRDDKIVVTKKGIFENELIIQ